MIEIRGVLLLEMGAVSEKEGTYLGNRNILFLNHSDAHMCRHSQQNL